MAGGSAVTVVVATRDRAQHGSAYLGAGGFHPRLGVGGEEELLAIDLAAAGWELCYEPGVVAHHWPPGPGGGPDRRRRQVRNGLWVAWLRRRWWPALRHTLRVAGQAADADARAGLLAALRDGGWTLRARRPVPPELEARLRRLPPAPPPPRRPGAA